MRSQIDLNFVQKRPNQNMPTAAVKIPCRYMLSTENHIPVKEFKEKLCAAGAAALADADAVLFDGARPTFVGHDPCFSVKAPVGKAIQYLDFAAGGRDATTEKLAEDFTLARIATMQIVVYLVRAACYATAATVVALSYG